MNQTIKKINTGFESSSGVTPEFKSFVRTFKKEFKVELESINATNIEFSVGHFYISGFYTIGTQIYYFTLNDVRYINAPTMMVRTAKSYNDYTGGHNNWFDIQTGMGEQLKTVR